VLGICLGGQLLAHALGARVVRAPRRTVAWVEVESTGAGGDDPVAQALGSPVRGLHWNEDRFDVPPGAVELLTRHGDGVTAFRAGDNAWGVQFHPEPTLAMLDGWTGALGHVMEANGVDPEATRQLGRRYVPEWAGHAAGMGRRFAAVAVAA
jgi:GMP synthase-like glutamine amidotransferase